MSPTRRYQIVFAVPPQVHLLDLSGPAHIFYEAASMGAPIDLSFLNMVPGQPNVKSTSGLQLNDLAGFDGVALDAGNYVFVPGLDASLLFSDTFKTETAPFRSWLCSQYQRGAFICSVCTGAFVLAEAGLLNDKACTTHWKFRERFTKEYPRALMQSNRLFIVEDTIVTSAGVSSGIDMALFLVEKMMGPVFASKVAREVVIYLRRSETDPQLSVFLQYRNHIDDRIHNVQDYLAQHLAERITIDQLAELVCMSPRNLTRLFKSTTRITIGAYHQRLRLEKARQLLMEHHKQDTVATECGLSTSQLRQLLQKEGPHSEYLS